MPGCVLDAGRTGRQCPSMLFDFTRLDARTRYKLLCATVAPRPIAWVSTMGQDGVPNAAPFSFFNVMGEDPALLVFSIGHRSLTDGKDTGQNIRARGEFVVNLVTENTVAAMNLTAADFLPHEDEFVLAELTPAPCLHIGVPRIMEARVSYECRLLQLIPVGAERTLTLGEALALHMDDGAVLDPQRAHIDQEALGLVGRMGGNFYCRASSFFELPRPTREDLLAIKNSRGNGSSTPPSGSSV